MFWNGLLVSWIVAILRYVLSSIIRIIEKSVEIQSSGWRHLSKDSMFYQYMFQSVVCQKSGKTAKLYMEKYCEMSGSYKPVSYSGVKEVLAVMGNDFSLEIYLVISTNGYIKRFGSYH